MLLSSFLGHCLIKSPPFPAQMIFSLLCGSFLSALYQWGACPWQPWRPGQWLMKSCTRWIRDYEMVKYAIHNLTIAPCTWIVNQKWHNKDWHEMTSNKMRHLIRLKGRRPSAAFLISVRCTSHLLPTSLSSTRCVHRAPGHHCIFGTIYPSTARTPGLLWYWHRYHIQGRGMVCWGFSHSHKVSRRGSFPSRVQESMILLVAQFLE